MNKPHILTYNYPGRVTWTFLSRYYVKMNISRTEVEGNYYYKLWIINQSNQ